MMFASIKYVINKTIKLSIKNEIKIKNESFFSSRTIIFEDKQITRNSIESNITLMNNQIDNVIEIKDYFFIRGKSGLSFVIPQQQIQNLEELRNILLDFCQSENINFIQDFDFKIYW